VFLSRKENLPHYFKLVIGFKNFYTIPIEKCPIFYSSIYSFANARSLYSLNYRKNIIHSAYHLHLFPGPQPGVFFPLSWQAKKDNILTISDKTESSQSLIRFLSIKGLKEKSKLFRFFTRLVYLFKIK